MTTKTFALPENVRNGIVEYLTTRPYSEVAGAVPVLMKLPEAQPGYALLAQCIRSGQVADKDVPSIMEQDPAFAAWYQAN